VEVEVEVEIAVGVEVEVEVEAEAAVVLGTPPCPLEDAAPILLTLRSRVATHVPTAPLASTSTTAHRATRERGECVLACAVVPSSDVGFGPQVFPPVVRWRSDFTGVAASTVGATGSLRRDIGPEMSTVPAIDVSAAVLGSSP
jgi:hypothetical protein